MIAKKEMDGNCGILLESSIRHDIPIFKHYTMIFLSGIAFFFLFSCDENPYNIELTEFTEDVITAYYVSADECGTIPDESKGMVLRSYSDDISNTLLLFMPHDFDNYFENGFMGYSKSRKGNVIKVFGNTCDFFFNREKKTEITTPKIISEEDDIRVYSVSIYEDTIVVGGGCGTLSEVMPLVDVCKKYFDCVVKVEDFFDSKKHLMDILH